MYTAERIKNNLNHATYSTSTGDYVAISVTLNEIGQASHSGLVIRYNDLTYYFHYDKRNVLLRQVDLKQAEQVFHKKLDIIDEQLIPSFLSHCKIIESTASPIYGYFYGGSYFENGIYHSNNSSPQLMTCVGFCINVLTGFIEEKNYIEFSDWQPVTDAAEKWFNDFIVELEETHPNVNLGELKKEFRRIKPSELISTGYFNDLPIRKIQTDQIKPVIEQIFKASI